MKKKHNVFFMIDILWNHCSTNSEWILEEPNCYFSPRNTPQLGAAFELDELMFKLSQNFKSLNVTENGQINTMDDVNKVISFVQREIIGPMNLREYFFIDVKKVIDNLMKAYAETEEKEYLERMQTDSMDLIFVESSEYELMKKQMRHFGKCPNGVEIDIQWLKHYLMGRFLKLNNREVAKLFRHINYQMALKVDGWVEELTNNIRDEIVYRFLKCNKNTVSTNYPLITRYFYTLSNGDAAALNGYVSGYAANEDFTTSPEQYYLQRRVIIWSDLIKLNYQTQDKCPKLWERMNEYTTKMALIFDGFRLDNFHNTNIQTAKYFINNAIQTNESLYLLSELFTDSPVTDAHYCLRVGVHRLVREFQNCYSLHDIIEFINFYSAETTNQITYIPPLFKNNYEISYLKPVRPLAILYDQTHDNSSFFEKFNVQMQLPLVAIGSFQSLMIGTVRGNDELFMHHIPVTSTHRYPRLRPIPFRVVNRDQRTLFLVAPKDLGKIIRKASGQCAEGRSGRHVQ